MELKDVISTYINDCIKDNSSGFRTDFGIGKIVSTHVYFHQKSMVVTISATKETKAFSIEKPSNIINWIYEKIK